MSEDLVQKAHISAIVRDFVKHPGYSLLKQFIDSKLQDARQDWLRASDTEALAIRQAHKAYLEIETYLKSLVIQGDVAAEKLLQHPDEM